MSNDLRVLQVIDHLHIGGAQRLLDVFQAAAGPGQGTRILSMGGTRDPMHLRLAARDVTIEVEPDCRLWKPSSYLRIFRALRRERPDVVHLHLTYATIIGAVAAWMARIPAVATVHNTNTVQDGGLRGSCLRLLETAAIRLFVRRVIFVGDMTDKANRQRFGRVPMVTIDNVVEPADPGLAPRRAQLRAGFGAEDSDVVILSTARLHPTKNIANLIEAFARVRRAHPAAKLWICGDGPLAGALAEQARQLQLGAAVTFMGGRDDVPALLQAADIFALSSDAEGLPLALLEAMSAGLPVVATAVGSVPAYVDEGTGLIVPPGSVDDLANALDTMIADAELRERSGGRARLRARDFTDIVGWRAALEAEYERAARRRPH